MEEAEGLSGEALPVIDTLMLPVWERLGVRVVQGVEEGLMEGLLEPDLLVEMLAVPVGVRRGVEEALGQAELDTVEEEDTQSVEDSVVQGEAEAQPLEDSEPRIVRLPLGLGLTLPLPLEVELKERVAREDRDMPGERETEEQPDGLPLALAERSEEADLCPVGLTLAQEEEEGEREGLGVLLGVTRPDPLPRLLPLGDTEPVPDGVARRGVPVTQEEAELLREALLQELEEGVPCEDPVGARPVGLTEEEYEGDCEVDTVKELLPLTDTLGVTLEDAAGVALVEGEESALGVVHTVEEGEPVAPTDLLALGQALAVTERVIVAQADGLPEALENQLVLPVTLTEEDTLRVAFTVRDLSGEAEVLRVAELQGE